MNLPVELRSSRKQLINIKNKDQKCLLWCHVMHINPSKEHLERIKKTNKKIAEKLDYDGIEFPVQEKDFSKIVKKNNICINVFRYENELVFPMFLSKILTDLCFTKQKIKTKNGFVRVACKALVVKVCWQNIKKIVWALMVNNL